MFSYLQSESKTQERSIPSAEAIVAHKKSLLAVPFNSMILEQARGSGRLRGRKRNKGKNGIGSKTYNIIAARPLAVPFNRVMSYPVNMRGNGVFLTSSASVPVFAAFSFQLSSFSDFTLYTSLFDQYRIDEIEIWIETQAGTANNSGNTGILSTCVDLDDANIPTSLASVEGHQSSLTSNAFAGHYHKWVPHMAVAAYSGVFTSFSNFPATWIDSGSPSVQHYGIKAAITSQAASTIFNYEVRAKVSFRQSGL